MAILRDDFYLYVKRKNYEYSEIFTWNFDRPMRNSAFTRRNFCAGGAISLGRGYLTWFRS